jgi:hypothetical protein
MTSAGLKKKVLGRALDYALRFEIFFDREMSEPDSAASTYFAARPCGVYVVGVAIFLFTLLVTFDIIDIIVVVLVFANVVVVLVVVSPTARNELSEYLQRVLQATTVID